MTTPTRAHPAPETAVVPRLVVAAPMGRSGKTTVTLGLCAALAGRGLTVQPFKKGPDYIDPSWLTEAAQKACRTLDPFFLESPEKVRQALFKGSRGADLCVVEGSHGLYDGLDDEGSTSTAAVARHLAAPIILVVNCTRMSRSVAALVRGYQTFEPNTHIAAVVLNNVARSRHETKLRRAVEQYCGIPVVGAFPRDDDLSIPDRHLGLVPRAENELLLRALEACRRAARQHLNLDAILQIARAAPPLPVAPLPARAPAGPPVRLGVVRDRAFTFYYPENFEALQEAGAELVFINAFTDTALPDIHGLYIGGGFPEMFLPELSANRALLQAVRAAISAGLPVYAECGGLMYLCQRIVWGEQSASMVGALPFTVELTNRPQGHGYVMAQANPGNPFFGPGAVIRGHEFHNSRVVNWQGQPPPGYQLQRGHGLGGGSDGLVTNNVLAAYTHLHAAGAPGWAQGLVAKARNFAEQTHYASS